MKKPGAFQFRVAVRDHDSAKIGTAAQFVAVPDLATNELTVSGIVLTSDAASTTPTETSPVGAESDRFALPGARTFQRGSSLVFGYAIYDAQRDKTTLLPQMTSQTRLFRDGKLVYTGASVPLSMAGQSDLQRITGGGRLQLGADFPIGEYVLQVVITDNPGKEKQRTATQWIDFEIVK